MKFTIQGSCLGQETAKGHIILTSSQAPSYAHLSTTLSGGFTLSPLIAQRQAGKLWILIFIVFSLTQVKYFIV